MAFVSRYLVRTQSAFLLSCSSIPVYHLDDKALDEMHAVVEFSMTQVLQEGCCSGKAEKPETPKKELSCVDAFQGPLIVAKLATETEDLPKDFLDVLKTILEMRMNRERGDPDEDGSSSMDEDSDSRKEVEDEEHREQEVQDLFPFAFKLGRNGYSILLSSVSSVYLQ